ncbi:hypothetical protein TO73_2868 (plasmid) [Thermus aquaticus Y51MC23]|uniref:Uncharacterized protein n=1 Tax=Thermus aquaticus (strain ATCC BAA-2747 / Y51MC23) TaxID=498848 RepID=A0ABM5VQN1_THEA5|nr:hypothetical protein TO73_2868 [Thermus aquaticus Y51MC23]
MVSRHVSHHHKVFHSSFQEAVGEFKLLRNGLTDILIA